MIFVVTLSSASYILNKMKTFHKSKNDYDVSFSSSGFGFGGIHIYDNWIHGILKYSSSSHFNNPHLSNQLMINTRPVMYEMVE